APLLIACLDKQPYERPDTRAAMLRLLGEEPAIRITGDGTWQGEALPAIPQQPVPGQPVSGQPVSGQAAPSGWGAPPLPQDAAPPASATVVLQGTAQPGERPKRGGLSLVLAACVGVIALLSGLGLWAAGNYASLGDSKQVAANGAVPQASLGLVDQSQGQSQGQTQGDGQGIGETPPDKVTVPWGATTDPQDPGVGPIQLNTDDPSVPVPSITSFVTPPITPPAIPTNPPVAPTSTKGAAQTSAPAATPTPAPTATVTVTPTPSRTPTSQVDPTPAPTATPTPSPSTPPTATPEPSATPTERDKPKPSATPTETDKPTPSPTPTETDKPTPKPTLTETDKPRPSATPTETEKPTPRPSATRPTETARPTPRPSWTPTPKPRPTETEKPTPKPSTTPPTIEPTTPTETDKPTPKPSSSTPPPSRPNPYNPQQVCGSGYYLQRSGSFSGGTTHQLYNTSTGTTCVVTMKSTDVGTATSVWATLEVQNGGSKTDRGNYEYYAGPVYLPSKGKCVRYTGGGPAGNTGADWANCG
ncbi:serine/threonine protein kinase, partial [Streptosporangium sp. NPDC000396]|uniref:serine/threonine protein kinase n=1 Tax=Streptosporangium sp. NPDC000396 TaxID=3366185 RepID=UPI00367D0DE0